MLLKKGYVNETFNTFNKPLRVIFIRMEIQNSKLEDIDIIYSLYKAATDMQIAKSAVPWPHIDKELIRQEIREKKQWKILINSRVACVFVTTESDPHIWLKRNKDPAIYIHRISTNPDFRGQYMVKDIVKWSIEYAENNNKKYIRMDTVGENHRLINYYKKCGFDFLGLSKLENTTGLPSHYHNATVCLFQIQVLKALNAR